MTPRKPEIFSREYAEELLGIALTDLSDAKALHDLKTGRRQENVLYLAVQAMEKALKAVMVAELMPVPFTHSLAFLAGRLSNAHSVPFAEELAIFEPFSTTLRYQNGSRPATWEEAREAVEVASQLLAWAKLIVYP